MKWHINFFVFFSSQLSIPHATKSPLFCWPKNILGPFVVIHLYQTPSYRENYTIISVTCMHCHVLDNTAPCVCSSPDICKCTMQLEKIRTGIPATYVYHKTPVGAELELAAFYRHPWMLCVPRYSLDCYNLCSLFHNKQYHHQPFMSYKYSQIWFRQDSGLIA